MVRVPKDLEASRVSPAHRALLAKGFDELTCWCVQNHVPLPTAYRTSPLEMDELFVSYIKFCHAENRPISQARRAVLGVQHRYRHLVRNLKQSWDVLKTWEMDKPLAMRIPCPEIIAKAIFCVALTKAFVVCPEEAHYWLPFGILVWTGWFGLLRPGEIIKLRCRDVVLPSVIHSVLGETGAVLGIENPKNRRQMGKRQVCKIDNELATKWLAWLTSGLDPDVKLFPSSYGKFLSLFKIALAELGLTHLGLTPASLRAGRATHLFISGVETSRLRVVGRWKCLETLDHYIQVAASALTLISLNSAEVCQLERIHSRAGVFQVPPVRPWSDFFSRAKQYRAHTLWTLNQWRRQSAGRKTSSRRVDPSSASRWV